MIRLGLRSYDKRLVPVISRKHVFAFELQHCNTATLLFSYPDAPNSYITSGR